VIGLEDTIRAQPTDAAKVAKARSNVRLSLEATLDWRKEAREDFRFVQGKQHSDKDIEIMRKQKRPLITINRCRPMINQVSGYFGQNMSEPNYMPRTADDDEICNIAKGVNKYVYDTCMFPRHKKKVGRDRLICGKGYYWVFYDFDYDRMDGTIKIERRSPFEVFVDPESIKEDLSDAEFVGVYSWESPDELEQVYPESATEIKLLQHKYDSEELAADTVGGEPIWYSKQLKKVRVVQYWYKERSYRNVYQIEGNTEMMDETEDLAAMYRLRVPGVRQHRIPSCQYKYMTFCDNVLLEENESPYKHKRFPLVQEFAYYTGEKDENDSTLEPAGLIRDLKDVQREVNKHRSQRMHIINTQANGIWLVYGTSTPEFDQQLKQFGTTPGAKLNVPPGVTKVERITPDGVSVANVEMERVSGEDFYTISGINPETMGNADAPSSMSGVAIDRRQRASFTQVSDLADEANYSERLIQDLLWGDKGRPGLIPQYFTEEKVLRIVGDDGANKFIQLAPNQEKAVNRQPVIDPVTGQPQVDEQGQLVHRVLYDLSKFEFDIVVVPSQSTPTLMAANLEQLIAAKQAGIPVPPAMLLEFMQIGNKQELKKTMQEEAANAAKTEAPKVSLTAAFKDLPVEAKAAMLTEFLGIQIDPQSLLQQDMIKNPPKQPPMQAVI
jgi:hypothetical protein